MCVLTNERYKTYQTGFLFGHLSHVPGWDLWVLGESKTLVWGFAMAPHRLRALVISCIEGRHCDNRMVQEYNWLPLILKGGSGYRMVQESH